MAIIIETCPKCGHDLHDIMLTSNPPIPKKECFNCGWSWQGEPEEVVRVPFGGNSFNYDDLTLRDNIDDECINADCCLANNLNRGVFVISRDNLDKISKINHDDIVAAIEKIKPYIKGE